MLLTILFSTITLSHANNEHCIVAPETQFKPIRIKLERDHKSWETLPLAQLAAFDKAFRDIMRYYEQLLRVVPRDTEIKSVTQEYSISATDVDLVTYSEILFRPVTDQGGVNWNHKYDEVTGRTIINKIRLKISNAFGYKWAYNILKHEYLHAFGFSEGLYNRSCGVKHPLTKSKSIPWNNAPNSSIWTYKIVTVKSFVERVRKIYKCPELEGIRLYTDNAHWDSTVLPFDAIQPIVWSEPIVSEVTAAFVEMTGHYKVNKDWVDKLPALPKFCDFFEKSCQVYVNDHSGEDISPYCSSSSGQSCLPNRLGLTGCMRPTKKEESYFCPILYTSSSCYQIDGYNKDSHYQVPGINSRCIDVHVLSRQKFTHGGTNTNQDNLEPACVEVICTGDPDYVVGIRSGLSNLTKMKLEACKEGKIVHFESNAAVHVGGEMFYQFYNRTLKCPPYREVCRGNTHTIADGSRSTVVIICVGLLLFIIEVPLLALAWKGCCFKKGENIKQLNNHSASVVDDSVEMSEEQKSAEGLPVRVTLPQPEPPHTIMQQHKAPAKKTKKYLKKAVRVAKQG